MHENKHVFIEKICVYPAKTQLEVRDEFLLDSLQARYRQTWIKLICFSQG